MRSIDNALADILPHYRALTYEIQEDTPKQWTVTVYNECAPGSYLKIEVHDVEGIPAALVMERHNIGRRSMTRFMDRLLDALDLD